jgi:type IV secretory pathway TrbL component
MTILCKHQLVISHGTLITKILVIPMIIAIYEKGFLEQNAIKSQLRASLKLESLNAMMQMSLCVIELENMDWKVMFELWCNMTK